MPDPVVAPSPSAPAESRAKPGLSADEAKEIVDIANKMYDGKDLQKYNGLGSIMINRALKGDIEAWRKLGKQHPSIKVIANHPDLHFSRLELYRGIGTFELWNRFGQLEKYPRVTATHIRSLLALLPDEQQYWMDRIQAENLTTRQLDAAIVAARQPSVMEELTEALVQVRTAFRQLDEIVDDADGLVADLVRAGVFNADGDPDLVALSDAITNLKEPLRRARARMTARTAPKPQG